MGSDRSCRSQILHRCMHVCCALRSKTVHDASGPLTCGCRVHDAKNMEVLLCLANSKNDLRAHQRFVRAGCGLAMS